VCGSASTLTTATSVAAKKYARAWRCTSRGGTRHISYTVIIGVSGHTMSLNIAETAVHDKLWHQRPSWLPAEAFNADFDHLVRAYPELDND